MDHEVKHLLLHTIIILCPGCMKVSFVALD